MLSASLVIGIEQYEHPAYSESDNRLRYAVADARAFHAYVKAAWGASSERHHQLLTDADATWSGVRGAAEALGALGPIDQLSLYFSGHGDVGPQGASFCLADTQPGGMGVGSARLAEIIEAIDPGRALLIVDCCHAEAVVAGTGLVGIVRPGRELVALCSARAGQRAWEEGDLKQSVFSHLLLRALTADSDLANAAGQVDTETRLFPYLAEQVPLRVLAKKRGQSQEPVKMSYLTSPLPLPTVAAGAIGRPLSVLDTVRARVRRVVASTAIALFVLVAVLDLSVFHLALSAQGEILVRPGPRAFFDVLPFHLSQSVDTGLTTDQLSRRDREAAQRISNGNVWGIRSHLDADGLRGWLQGLQGFLEPGAAWRVNAFARGRVDSAPLDSESNPPPTEELLFLTEIGGRDRRKSVPLYELPYSFEPRCRDDPGSHLDYTVLLPPTALFAGDLLWLAVTAPRERQAALEQIETMVRLTAYRARLLREEGQALLEFRALERALRQVARGNRFEPTELSLELGAQGWCRLHHALAVGLVGDEASQRLAEEVFVVEVGTFDLSQQGDLLTEPQGMALSGLVSLSRRRPLQATNVARVLQLIVGDPRGLQGVRDFIDWVGYVAAAQRLPEDFVSYLFEHLRREHAENDFSELEAVRLLSAGARYLSPEEIHELVAWVGNHVEDYRTQEGFAEALGFLASAATLPDDWVAALADQIDPEVYFEPTPTTARGTVLITASDEAARVALGRVAQTQDLDARLTFLLERVALRGPQRQGRSEVVSGLVAQRPCDVELPRCIYRDVSAARTRARQRTFEVDMAVERISRSLPRDRDHTLAALSERWEHETEPEIRLALAEVIARAGLVEE